MTPVSTETAVRPHAGTTTSVSSGETVAVTDPSGIVNIVAPESGNFEVASGTVGADIVIDGPGTAELTIGLAQDAEGNLLSSAGTTYQIADDYEGSATVNLSGAITNGPKVDLTIATPEGSSIADNAPTGASDIDIYVKTGAGNDQVEGTSGNDFIRLGAGDDVFNAGGGDDIVRVGSGDDSGSLGAGADIVYLTVDQLQGESVNTIDDFTSGEDKIQIDSDLQGRVTISGEGTNAIRIELSGTETGTTGFVSEAGTIDGDDIEFV